MKNIKINLASIFLVLGLFCLMAGNTACRSRKSGCPVNEQATAKANRKGEYGSKKGKSNLFPKKMRKSMGY